MKVVSNFKEMSTKKKVATIASAAVAVGAIATTAVAFSKGKKIQADAFVGSSKEDNKALVNVLKAVKAGYGEIGKNIADSKAAKTVVKGFEAAKDFVSNIGKKNK